MQRIMICGCPMDAATMDETLILIAQRINDGQFTQHVVVNVAKITQMQDDPELARSIQHCDIINIDGMGVVWAARWLGYQVAERVAGIDLFYRLNGMAESQGLSVFYLGATEEVVNSAVARMQARHPQLKIAGHHHGYFWDNEEAVVEKIRASSAQMLFVAITSPRKERFIQRWREQLGVQFVMGVGGTFDVVAGKVRRAPGWMQHGGLEWLYRLLQEPSRMWRRYLVSNTRFAWMLIREKYRRIRKL